MPPLIQLTNITKTYPSPAGDTHVLKGISLTLNHGSFTTIMGQSGSGKSTLMNIIGLLDTPTTGTYLLSGTEVSHLTEDQQAIERSKNIGFVFQSYNLLPRLSALEQVLLPLRYQGTPISAAQKKAIESLRRVGLSERLHSTPAQLSGGQMQRVAIARALSTGAHLILADEPTGALDSTTGIEVMHLLTTLHTEGSTILLITHDPTIARHAQTTHHLKDGAFIPTP